MKVAVDVGNTHTILGLVEDENIQRRYRLETRPGMTSDELMEKWTSLLEISEQDALNLMVASVVPEITNEIRMLDKRERVSVSFLSPPWEDASVEVVSTNPDRVGADRVAGAVALQREFDEGIVVDFGTATTLDLVSPPGVYQGGVIFPGIEASAEGLSSQAAMLPQVSPDVPESFSISDTPSGLLSGLFYGTSGAVERLIEELVDTASLGDGATVVATGGGADDLSDITPSITHVRKNLVLTGLVAALCDQFS